MKKLLFVCVLAAFAACGSNTSTEEVKKDSIAAPVVDSVQVKANAVENAAVVDSAAKK